ncbi:hypothetical protein Hanom_Chr10g00909271 [Helianthus anomalus]
MWHSGKIHSSPDLTLSRFRSTYQISGRNFFQVGDDVTTRVFTGLSLTRYLLQFCFRNLFVL